MILQTWGTLAQSFRAPNSWKRDKGSRFVAGDLRSQVDWANLLRLKMLLGLELPWRELYTGGIATQFYGNAIELIVTALRTWATR